LTVIVANELASTDKRFCDPFDSAPARLLFKPVGGYFLSFLPDARERRVCLPGTCKHESGWCSRQRLRLSHCQCRLRL
jgi:hypothetical protein